MHMDAQVVVVDHDSDPQLAALEERAAEATGEVASRGAGARVEVCTRVGRGR
jgi:hypothetical protein